MALNCSSAEEYSELRAKLYVAFERLELARSFERYLKSGSGHP